MMGTQVNLVLDQFQLDFQEHHVVAARAAAAENQLGRLQDGVVRLQVLNSSDDIILWSKYQLINGAVSSYGDFINVDVPAGEQLRFQQSSGTTVTVTLAIECTERK